MVISTNPSEKINSGILVYNRPLSLVGKDITIGVRGFEFDSRAGHVGIQCSQTLRRFCGARYSLQHRFFTFSSSGKPYVVK